MTEEDILEEVQDGVEDRYYSMTKENKYFKIEKIY
jgi:hypothetical protein